MPTLQPASEATETLSALDEDEHERYVVYPSSTTYPGPTTYPGDYEAGYSLATAVEGTETLAALAEGTETLTALAEGNETLTTLPED